MSRLFKRINDIINASVNDLVDKLEDPERMIKQIIREMEENIGQAKEGVLSAITSEKQLLHELEAQRKQSAQWLSKAESALQQSNDSLARAALERKREFDGVIGTLEPAWQSAKGTSDRLKSQLRQLEAKLDEAKRKRTTLLARQHAAEAQQQMSGTLETFRSGIDAQDRFGRMEDKVAIMEARTEALSELNDEATPLETEIERLEIDQAIDAEMAALKASMGKTVPTSTASTS